MQEWFLLQLASGSPCHSSWILHPATHRNHIIKISTTVVKTVTSAMLSPTKRALQQSFWVSFTRLTEQVVHSTMAAPNPPKNYTFSWSWTHNLRQWKIWISTIHVDAAARVLKKILVDTIDNNTNIPIVSRLPCIPPGYVLCFLVSVCCCCFLHILTWEHCLHWNKIH